MKRPHKQLKAMLMAEAKEVIDECREDTRLSGKRYEQGNNYLSALIMARELLLP